MICPRYEGRNTRSRLLERTPWIFELRLSNHSTYIRGYSPLKYVSPTSLVDVTGNASLSHLDQRFLSDAERTLPRTGQQDLLQLGRTTVQAGSECLQSGGSQAKAQAALVTPLVTEIGRHIRPTES